MNKLGLLLLTLCVASTLSEWSDIISALRDMGSTADAVLTCAENTDCENSCLSTKGCVWCASGSTTTKLLGVSSTDTGSYCWTGSFDKLTNTDLTVASNGITASCSSTSIHSSSCGLSDAGIVAVPIVVSIVVCCMLGCVTFCCCRRRHRHHGGYVPVHHGHGHHGHH